MNLIFMTNVAPKFMRSYLDKLFYIFSAVVSLVGLNVNFGVTLYLSRLFIAIFLIGLLISLSVRGPSYRLYINKLAAVFSIILALILIQHFMSVIISERVEAGLRQILIYSAVMILFIIILSINLQISTIIKGLKIFLAVGFFQGCYGIYQVFGGPFGLPTYQSFMFWPTANDKTVDGFLFSGVYKLFRANGFFPGDVSHYAAYMSTIIVLAIVFVLINSRSKYLKIGLFISVLALLLSLSRSGLLALLLFGLPTLFILIVKLSVLPKKIYLRFFSYLSGVIILLMFFGAAMGEALGIDISNLFDVIIRRLNDLVNVGADKQGSMGIHILTRLMAVDAVSLNPMFGVGLGVNASPWFSEAYNQGWAGSHSHHLDILGQTGIFGAILEWFFMLMVGHYMWRGLKLKEALFDERLILAGLFSIFILIIFGNLFYHYYLNDFVWYFFATGIALSRAMLIKYSKT